MKRILVTGGAGFLGSHLCDYLINKGNYVICLDNFFTGSKNNIKHFLKNKNFKLIEHDIINPLFISDKIDQIYNLACPASPGHYQYNAIRTIKANTIGMINMLGLAKQHRARILQASTSEVYGDPTVHPQTESYRGNVNTLSVRACYDEGKRVAECLMMDYHRQNKVDTRIVRIFNTYGPMMAKNDGRAISNFIVQALQNKDITVYGKGTQTRSFCYVSDLIEGIYKTIESDYIYPINIGNPNEFTILELAKKVIRLTNSKSKIIYKPLPQDDPKQRQPNITLAKKILKWEPTVPLDKGLKETINYFKKVI